MIITFDRLSEIDSIDFKICIIGSGAAAITLAMELESTNAAIALIDGVSINSVGKASQEPYEGATNGIHPRPHLYRRLAFGGSTTIWGGRCVPFDPIDFEARAEVDNSGWPITYEEVNQYYPAAMMYCQAGKFDFTFNSFTRTNTCTIPEIASDADINFDIIERYSKPTDFGKEYGQRIADSKNVYLLKQSHAIRLIKAHDNSIASVEYATRDGGRKILNAKLFVLASGGLEVPRILMFSDRSGTGFGNKYDHLGRYYMCHLEGIAGKIATKSSLVAFNFEKTNDKIYARRKIQISEVAQKRESILNICFRLHYPNISDPKHGSSILSAIFLAKHTLIPEYRYILQHGKNAADYQNFNFLKHIKNITLGLPSLLAFSIQWLLKRTLSKRKIPYVLTIGSDKTFPVEYNSEQIPLFDSRVVLTKECDSYGVPRLLINWRHTTRDVESIYKAYLILQSKINASKNSKLLFDDNLYNEINRSVPVGGHHMGTTRMASRESDGVVDTNCRVFGLSNLFVASASVFPTCSHANPTLTIVALAIRLAKHLKNEIN